jgi:hypothetical protein
MPRQKVRRTRTRDLSRTDRREGYTGGADAVDVPPPERIPSASLSPTTIPR